MPEINFTPKVIGLMDQLKLEPFDIVRLCGLSPSTIYKIKRGEFFRFDVYWKIYKGLRDAGYEIKLRDVVDWDE